MSDRNGPPTQYRPPAKPRGLGFPPSSAIGILRLAIHSELGRLGDPHVISQSRRIGTAMNPFAETHASLASYSTTPEVKRLPGGLLEFP